MIRNIQPDKKPFKRFSAKWSGKKNIQKNDCPRGKWIRIFNVVFAHANTLLGCKMIWQKMGDRRPLALALHNGADSLDVKWIFLSVEKSSFNLSLSIPLRSIWKAPRAQWAGLRNFGDSYQDIIKTLACFLFDSYVWTINSKCLAIKSLAQWRFELSTTLLLTQNTSFKRAKRQTLHTSCDRITSGACWFPLRNRTRETHLLHLHVCGWFPFAWMGRQMAKRRIDWYGIQMRTPRVSGR